MTVRRERSQVRRLAITPDAAAPVEADDLELVVRLPAALVETIARRAAEILTEADPPRGQSYLTVNEAASRLGVHRNTIRRAIKDGRLAAGRVGTRGAWRIETNALDRLIGSSPGRRTDAEAMRAARRRRTPIATTTSFSARARAENKVEPRRQTRSTKEVPVSVQPRDGTRYKDGRRRWVARWSGQPSKVFLRKADASAYEAHLRQRAQLGAHAPATPSADRLADYLNAWWSRESPTWANSTRSQRGAIIDRWVTP